MGTLEGHRLKLGPGAGLGGDDGTNPFTQKGDGTCCALGAGAAREAGADRAGQCGRGLATTAGKKAEGREKRNLSS